MVGTGGPCAGLAGVVAGLWLVASPASAAAQNPIADENALPGDRSWALTRTAPPGVLEAYAGEPSVQHGEPIDLHVRADGPHTVQWSVYRMGWYGGAAGRRVAQGGPVPVGPQPVPAPDPSTGIVECRWPTSFTLQTDPTWTTGVYLVKLQRDDGPQTYAIFVVRADERKGVAVVQASFTTYQAYNYYGGKSLYVGPAQEVSFDRPYAEGAGSGQFLRYELDFVRWAEARGFDLGYLTDVDVDRDASLLQGQRIFLSVGHDEYWSRRQRDAVEAALAAGVNMGYLGGNGLYWQIRLEPSRLDPTRPRRTQVCYKKLAPTRDPLRGTPLMTVQWRDPALGAPEDALLGVMYSTWALADAPWVVASADHWVYEGTGLRDGDTLPGLVGYETDRTWGDGRAPADLTRLSRSPVVDVNGGPEWQEAALSVRPSGAFVFAASSIEFVWGLAHPGCADPRVQRMMENVLRRAGLAPASATDPVFAGPAAPDVRGAAEGVATLAGQAFAEGLVDGPGRQARFRRPSGAAVDAAGQIFVADTGNHAIRLVHADAARTVETILGDGTPGDGDGRGARLRSPQAVAVASDGSVAVADTGNSRIVRLVKSGAGWTAATLAGASGFDGADDGPAAQARFSGPSGLAYVGADLYVADRQNHTVRKIGADGVVSTVAGANDGTWLQDGPAAQARFHFPSALAADGGGLDVLDAGNRVVRRIDLSPGGGVTTLAGVSGGGFADGAASEAKFMPVAGIAAGGGGDVLVADAGNARVRRVSGGAVTTWAGNGQVGGLDGTGAEAQLAGPTGIAPLGGGVWVVVDGASSTLRAVGAVTPPAGGSSSSGSSSSSGGSSSSSSGSSSSSSSSGGTSSSSGSSSSSSGGGASGSGSSGGGGPSGGPATGGGKASGGGCATGGEAPGSLLPLAVWAAWRARRRSQLPGRAPERR